MSDAVRGHRCVMLEAFQIYGGGCKPKFDNKGEISGCDDSNEISLLAAYCPFCGTKFPITPTLSAYQKSDLIDAMAEVAREKRGEEV